MVLWAMTESAFGVAYAYGVHRYTTNHPEHPYTSFEVVAGVLATIGLTMLLLPAFIVPCLWLLGAFVCTGWPQVFGDMYRNTTRQTRIASREAQRDETIDQLRRKVDELQHELIAMQVEVGIDE